MDKLEEGIGWIIKPPCSFHGFLCPPFRIYTLTKTRNQEQPGVTEGLVTLLSDQTSFSPFRSTTATKAESTWPTKNITSKSRLANPQYKMGTISSNTEMNTAPTFQKDELQIVYQPKETVKEKIGGEELRVFIKVYAKEGRLPSDLTKAKIEELVLNRVRDEFYPEEEPSEGGTTTTTNGSLATTNSTS